MKPLLNIFDSPALVTVLLGSMLISAMSALIGTFSFLRKRSLIGDVISHAVLPGIALAFLLTSTKNLLPLLIGGAATGALAAWLIDLITQNSKIKADTAIALNTSVFFGFGMVLLSWIQHSGAGNQSGLDHFLFGKAAALQSYEVRIYFWMSLFIALVLMVGFRAFKMISFDEQYSHSIGLPTRFIRLVLMFLTVMVVAIGVQSVGVVLMSALLITPAAIGRFFSSSLKGMMLIALLSGMFSGASGALISYAFPSMPTGPWIVLWLSALAVLAFLFSARKGILVLWFKKWQNGRRIELENFIKTFYHSLKEDEKQLFDIYHLPEPMKAGHAKRLLTLARLRGWVNRFGRNQFGFTHEGLEAVKSIVRKHRLWELYLSRYLQLEADHVHDNAEEMEHLITPELEKDLYELLDRPDKDPHDSEIPF